MLYKLVTENNLIEKNLTFYQAMVSWERWYSLGLLTQVKGQGYD